MRRILVVLFLTALAIVGCSGGGTPVTPVSNERPAVPTDSLSIIEGTSYSDGSFQASGILGAYELRIDPATMSADLVAKRTPSLGESWTVSGEAFFTIKPCSNCLTIDSIELTAENYLKAHFAISHPFDPGISSLPPSGKNRLDLDIWDVAAVFVPLGATATNYSLLGKAAYTGILAMNAGYTTELANITMDPAAMPYALVVDDNAAVTNTWNKFAMGTDSFFDVFFDLNTITTLGFDMYLTFGYGRSAEKKVNRLQPTYFNPEFNRKQAWKVVATPPEGTDPPAMGNTWNDSNTTDTYNVKVEVFDWQQGVTTIAKPPVLPTDIAEASNVSSVSVDIPGMCATLPSVTTSTGGTGGPADPLVFEVPIANQNQLAAGEYIGLVRVTDERVPETTPPGTDNIDYLIHTPDGIALVNYAIPAYETYQTFVATVVIGCGPITGSITTPTCPLIDQNDGAKIDFTVTASSANGGDPITLYECDYDYDGTTFTTDFSNATGAFTAVGPFAVPAPCLSNIPQTFTVAFRAADSCAPPNVTIFATCDVTVTKCVQPIHSIKFEPTPSGDTFYDIGKQATSPGYVYIAADHPATGNTNMTRTCLQYAEDLTGMVVLNPGSGMANVWGNPFTTPFNRCDVSYEGYIGINPETKSWGQFNFMAPNQAVDMLGGAYTVSCGSWIYGVYGHPDVWDQRNTSSGATAATVSWNEIFDCGVIYESNIWGTNSANIGFSYRGNQYSYSDVKAIDGFNGSNNVLFFLSSASVGKVSVSGPWFPNYSAPGNIRDFGTYGTGDQQFYGGIDVTIDSNNNIVTLEQLSPSSYRFQKLSWDGVNITWIYSSQWGDSGNPKRIDFNRCTTGPYPNHLYLISDTGMHICVVQ